MGHLKAVDSEQRWAGMTVSWWVSNLGTLRGHWKACYVDEQMVARLASRKGKCLGCWSDILRG